LPNEIGCLLAALKIDSSSLPASCGDAFAHLIVLFDKESRNEYRNTHFWWMLCVLRFLDGDE
jgi:hypothetical protein